MIKDIDLNNIEAFNEFKDFVINEGLVLNNMQYAMSGIVFTLMPDVINDDKMWLEVIVYDNHTEKMAYIRYIQD